MGVGEHVSPLLVQTHLPADVQGAAETGSLLCGVRWEAVAPHRFGWEQWIACVGRDIGLFGYCDLRKLGLCGALAIASGWPS